MVENVHSCQYLLWRVVKCCVTVGAHYHCLRRLKMFAFGITADELPRHSSFSFRSMFCVLQGMFYVLFEPDIKKIACIQPVRFAFWFDILLHSTVWLTYSWLSPALDLSYKSSLKSNHRLFIPRLQSLKQVTLQDLSFTTWERIKLHTHCDVNRKATVYHFMQERTIRLCTDWANMENKLFTPLGKRWPIENNKRMKKLFYVLKSVIVRSYDDVFVRNVSL